jgi:hypothetical protein
VPVAPTRYDPRDLAFGELATALDAGEALAWQAKSHLTKWYQCTKITPMKRIERVQTGVRLEKRLLKVLKALAEYLDISLGDLLEGIVLHTFEGRTPFSDATLSKIADLKAVYGLDLTAADSHRLDEEEAGDGR